MIYHSTRIITDFGTIDGYLVVEDGRIVDIVRRSVEELQADCDFGDCTIIPGIFDTHNHGYMGWNPSDVSGGVEMVLGYTKAIAGTGLQNYEIYEQYE